MQRSLARFLDSVAAATPAPGGGSSAAAAAALGAALVEMTAAFTVGRDRYSGGHDRMTAISERARARRAELLELTERELRSYEPVLEAIRLPEDEPDRQARIRRASSAAAEPPLDVARAAAEVAELGSEAVRTGNTNLVGDAVVGAVLAEAACRGAARLVEINLGGLSGDPRLAEVSELVTRAARAREEALA